MDKIDRGKEEKDKKREREGDRQANRERGRETTRQRHETNGDIERDRNRGRERETILENSRKYKYTSIINIPVKTAGVNNRCWKGLMKRDAKQKRE